LIFKSFGSCFFNFSKIGMHCFFGNETLNLYILLKFYFPEDKVFLAVITAL
jgi:hypothetical protein